MRRIKLSKQEQEIEENITEFVPVKRQEYLEIAQSIAARKKDAVLNIRVNSEDLSSLKQKAGKLGVKYQTFISEILHRIAQA